MRIRISFFYPTNLDVDSDNLLLDTDAGRILQVGLRFRYLQVSLMADEGQAQGATSSSVTAAGL